MIHDCLEITGSRISDNVFMRASGVWIPHALKGYFAFSCESSQYYVGSWLSIIDNTETSLTVDGTLDTEGTAVRLSAWNPLTKLISFDYGTHNGNGRFWGGCIDTKRRRLWPAPNGSDVFVEFDIDSETVSRVFAHGYEGLPSFQNGLLNSLFFGMIYDQVRDKIYPIPGICPDIVIIDPNDPENFVKYPHGQEYSDPENPNANGLFGSGFITADELWLAPYSSLSWVIFNLDSHTIERFSLPSEYFQYAVGAPFYDGSQFAYCYEYTQGLIIKIDISAREVVKTIYNPFWRWYSWNPESTVIQVALYTDWKIHNNNLYMSPDWGPILIIDLETDIVTHVPLSGMAKYSNWPTAAGQYMAMDVCGEWLVFWGLNTPVISFLNPTTNDLFTLPYGLGQGSFNNAVWDDQKECFWAFPCVPPYLAKIKPDLALMRRGFNKLNNIQYAPALMVA